MYSMYNNILMMVFLEKYRESFIKSVMIIAVILLVAISLYYNL